MTVVKIDIQGISDLLSDFKQVGALSGDVVEGVITDLVLETHGFAVQGIQSGPASGITYEKYNPRRTHRASAPGEYPMSDTGRLASSVKMELPTGADMTGRVGTGVQYGKFLEFGTSSMGARPWLIPSFEKAKIGVTNRLREEFEAMARK